MTIHKIPFEGKPVWIGCENIFFMLVPVTGKPTKDELQSMVLAMDEYENGDYEYFIKKMTKEDLLLKTKHEFDCEHDWILARMFLKEKDEWFVVTPEDDSNRLKINLSFLPAGAVGDLPVQWWNQEEEN